MKSFISFLIIGLVEERRFKLVTSCHARFDTMLKNHLSKSLSRWLRPQYTLYTLTMRFNLKTFEKNDINFKRDIL